MVECGDFPELRGTGSFSVHDVGDQTDGIAPNQSYSPYIASTGASTRAHAACQFWRCACW